MTWECHPDCKAECCGIVHMPGKLYRDQQHLHQVKPDRLIVVQEQSVGKPEIVVPVTADFRCIFLNRETFKCTIYSARPDVCRRYGQEPKLLCSYVDMTGTFRTLKDRAKVQKYMDKRTEKIFKAVKAKKGMSNAEEEVIINQVAHDSQTG